MRMRTLLGTSLAAVSFFSIVTGTQIPSATAEPTEPTINAEPIYCTGNNKGPAAGPRGDGHDTVQASAEITCQQNQFVEVIFHITGDNHNWVDDVVGWVPTNPAVLCSGSCVRTFTTPNHQVGGDLNGQIYTVSATVKIWTTSGVLCGANCYPLGTPLRTFQLPAVSAPVYD
jgi:hypothetical protein